MWLKIYDKSLILDQQINYDIGRFWPFGLWDLNILMQISSSPYVFFSFNALCVVIFALAYTKILHFTNPHFYLNQILVILLCLSFGFCVVNFGICYPERNLIVFLSVFILASFYALHFGSKVGFVIGIVALNFAIYLKEPVFIAAFVIGAILLFGSIKNNNAFCKKFSVAILISSVVYAIIYLAFIFPKIGSKTYGRWSENTDIALETMRGLLNYAINDGLVVFALSGVFVYRIYAVFYKKEPFEPYFDAFLAGSVAYFCVFIKLGIFESYYLLPCYVLGGVSAVHFLRLYSKNIFVKIAVFMGLFGFFTSNIPSGIYTMINLKAMGLQFHQTLAKSADYIRANPQTHIYFDGIGRGREIYAEWYAGYFGEYLRRLYNVSEFDLRTSEPNLKDIMLDSKSPFTLRNSLVVSEPREGDLLILNATTIHKVDEKYMDSLLRRYDLYFTSDFPTIPYIALKPMIKYANTRILGSNHGIFGHQNIFRTPLKTYIFIAK